MASRGGSRMAQAFCASRRAQISTHLVSTHNDHTHDMMVSDMKSVHRNIKKRRTFTLSPASLAYLEQETRQRKANSQSAVLDELLQEKTRDRQMDALETSIGAYYDGLGDPEIEEDKIWGDFAGSQLALREDEPAYDESTTRRDLVHETSDRPSGKRKAPGGHRLSQRTKQPSEG